MTVATTVRKAVFPVAGLGTRFLPATKASPKEMLPVVDKPLIQYAVEEAYAAGIRHMIFVTGRSKRAIEDHFDTAYELEAELEAAGKKELLELVRSIQPSDMDCAFVRQPRSLGLGHACRAVACEFLDIRDQDHPVFQQHGDSSRLRPMTNDPDPSVASPEGQAPDGRASFGFRDVPAAEKAGLVARVFESVAPRYDLMNDLMSGGVHRLWKNAMVDVVHPRPGERILDVAGGTGDIAFRMLRRQGDRPDVTVCDINPAMLEVGRDRAIDRGLLQGLTWTTGDAEKLPFPDRSFDAYTIAFGLRNVTDIDAALADAYRVLKPGGRFFCLEFSKVTSAPVGRVYDAYSERALPFFGKIIAKDADSYRYLHESIRRFPPQRELAARMRAVGFANVAWRDMSLGVVALHQGWRI